MLFIDASRQDSMNARLFCKTCAYQLQLKKEIRKHIQTTPKKVDEVLEDVEWSSKTTAGQKCEKCGNEEAFFYELQTRSADEPATIFFQCSNSKCRHQWKEG